jgi:hypothetical protein
MTPRYQRALVIAIAAVLFSILIAAAYAKSTRQVQVAQLAIEIALSKPFYIPATTGSGRVASVFIKVPIAQGTNRQPEDVSAIRLEPQMEGDKVKVTVYALKGEADNINSCRDWNKLQATTIGTYLAGIDEEVSLTKLKDYGISMGNAPLTFRVVARRVLSPVPETFLKEACDCGSCNGSICCPNPGYCLPCNPCGTYCCPA